MRLMVGCLAALLLLTGCTSVAAPSNAPSPTPPPSTVPTLADAENAAKASYTSYLEAANLIAQQGGSDADRIRPFVTPQLAEDEVAGYGVYARNGTRLDGASTFDQLRVSEVKPEARAVVVRAFLCLDLSGTRLLNDEGEDITPASRPLRTPLEVQFVSAEGAPGSLLLDRNAPWTGDNFCS
jgi:hypothetical protein